MGRAGGQLGVMVCGIMHKSVGMCLVVGELRVEAQSSEVRLKLLCVFVVCTALFFPCSWLFCAVYVHEVLYCVFFEGVHVFIVSLALSISVGSFSLDCWRIFLLLLFALPHLHVVA